MIIKTDARNLEVVRREGSAEENQRRVSTESRACACAVPALTPFADLRDYSQSHDYVDNEHLSGTT